LSEQAGSGARRRPSRALAAGAALAALVAGGALALPAAVTAKTPGATYCYAGTCHRVRTLAETSAEVGRQTIMRASYYDRCGLDRHNPCGLTSSGARFRPERPDNAASPIYPDGTVLLLFHPANGRAAVVRVDNAGPYRSRRQLDVSRATADQLGFRSAGVADLVVRVLSAPEPEEARYRRLRTYDPVAGYLGQHVSPEVAEAAAVRLAPAVAGAMYEVLDDGLEPRRTLPPLAASSRLDDRHSRRVESALNEAGEAAGTWRQRLAALGSQPLIDLATTPEPILARSLEVLALTVPEPPPAARRPQPRVEIVTARIIPLPSEQGAGSALASLGGAVSRLSAWAQPQDGLRVDVAGLLTAASRWIGPLVAEAVARARP
jgi:rare lipoprotein A (peptidoglycan hydrolase)